MEERNGKQVKRNRIIIIISAALVILLLILLLSIKSCHKHEYTSVVTEPTCTEMGFTTYTCKCGDSYVSDETEAKGHTYSDWKVVKEATETETGLKEKECIICNDKVTEEISKLSHTHNYTETVVDATCVDKGYKEYTCTCGDTYREEIEALGHTEVEVEGKEATCTEAGKTAGKKCSVCGEVTVPQTDINPLGHTYGEWKVVKEATETEEGLKERKCNNCNELETQTIPTLSHTHTYTSVVTNPTCTTKGYTTYTCSCGDSYKDNEVEALGHTYSDWKVVKEATETETGLKEKECSICKDKVTEEISKLEHTHTYTTTITEPTCADKGYTTYTCSCGDTYKDNETDVLDHTYISVVTEPTCISEGYTTYTCSCGDTYKDDYTEIIEHNYITLDKIDSTCTEIGFASCKCSYCGDVILVVIDVKSHSFHTETIDATCTTDGYTINTCDCNYVEITDYAEHLNHIFVDGKCTLCGRLEVISYDEYDEYKEEEKSYIDLGRYPQSLVTDTNLINELSKITNVNAYGYIEYNGREYKEKNLEYYLVEPIKWRILNENSESYQLISEFIIDGMFFYDDPYDIRMVDGKTIYGSNYEYSNIRAWLNGYDGSSYSVNNYTNKGFFDIAFSEDEQNVIIKNFVDNNTKVNPNIACDNTIDYVTLLSMSEIYNPEYGFVSFDARLARETDYVPKYNDRIYWLRTPGYEIDAYVLDYYYGDTHAEDFMLYQNYGVRPVITVSKNYHIHSYITETVESTCTYRGYTVNKCACGQSLGTESLELADHTYIVETVFPPCIGTSRGYSVFKCHCGKSYIDDYVDIIDHNFVNDKCDMCGLIKNGVPYEENGNTYINLGMYPQSVVTDSYIYDALENSTNINENGYIEYRGKLYIKQQSEWCSSYMVGFNDGSKIKNMDYYYILLQPIKWLVISEDENTYQLLSVSALETVNYLSDKQIINLDSYNSELYFDDNKVDGANYHYSDVRAWLNGYDLTLYRGNNYSNKGFIDTTFTEEEKALINTTFVNNSTSFYIEKPTEYTYNDTYDKIYLLSYQDVINSNYGFDSNSGNEDKARFGLTTDYLRLKAISLSTQEGYIGNAGWMLRGPHITKSFSSNQISYINTYGKLEEYRLLSYVTLNLAIRPAMTIKKNNHEHTFTSEIISSTCQKEGYTISKCDCGYIYTSDYTNISGHVFTNDVCVCGLVKNGIIYEENGNKYINLGMYPKTVVTNYKLIDKLDTITTTNSLGYIEYNGKEYVKLIPDTLYDYNHPSCCFENGNVVNNYKTYYFLVEPIKWRVISENSDSYQLICTTTIETIPFFNGDETRTIDGITIYSNNYEYSNIRAWLNGYNGSSYGVSDYTDKGFINMVFTDEEKALIKTTLVDNSAATTDNLVNEYVCNNTNDKVYLLSFKDLLDINYGFNSNIFADEKRVINTSDYAKCTDTYYSTYMGNALWISRSPDSTNAKGIFIVNENGKIVSDTLGRNLSIIPAITISK